MKNRATAKSAQMWIKSIVQYHGASRDLFAVTYMLSSKTLTLSVCYIITRFISGTTAHRSIH